MTLKIYLNEKMAFAVEFALAVAEKDTSAVQIRNKQDLYHALTDRETLYKILEQALIIYYPTKNTLERNPSKNKIFASNTRKTTLRK